jgi:hypothetical protein
VSKPWFWLNPYGINPIPSEPPPGLYFQDSFSLPLMYLAADFPDICHLAC